MVAPGLKVAVEGYKVRREFTAEYPEFVKLNEHARKAARKAAKAFPAPLRMAYFVDFCDGVTGQDTGLSLFPQEQIAYVCGGIDGSAWA